MPDSIALLNELWEANDIRLHRGQIFDRAIAPKPKDFDFSRVEGMLLGVAIGDALGATSEAMSPSKRAALFGEIRSYQPNTKGERRGYPTDDTQLTFWMLESILECDGVDADAIARQFATRGQIFGIGATMLQFLSEYKVTRDWREARQHSAGNGALMRVTPLLLPHLRHGGTGLWHDLAVGSLITHDDASSTSACVAMGAILWELLDRTSPPEPMWWVDTYVSVAHELEGNAQLRPRGGRYKDSYCGPLWQFIDVHVREAVSARAPLLDTLNSWYSGAYLLETMPAVLLILSQYADSPAEAIIRAVNDTRDNDTIASIVGGAMGALHGKGSFPADWVQDLTGSTLIDDEGHVQHLIQKARKQFWELA